MKRKHKRPQERWIDLSNRELLLNRARAVHALITEITGEQLVQISTLEECSFGSHYAYEAEATTSDGSITLQLVGARYLDGGWTCYVQDPTLPAYAEQWGMILGCGAPAAILWMVDGHHGRIDLDDTEELELIAPLF